MMVIVMEKFAISLALLLMTVLLVACSKTGTDSSKPNSDASQSGATKVVESGKTIEEKLEDGEFGSGGVLSSDMVPDGLYGKENEIEP